MTAVELLPPTGARPDNPRWHELRRAGLSASEIAAVVGLSPWESAFSLHWRKTNGWKVEQTEDMTNGHRLEAAVADWWAETQDPLENLAVAYAGLYAHPERPWQLATPDRLVHPTCACCAAGCVCGLYGNCADCLNAGHGGPPCAVLECKWTGRWDGWGDDGTDDIPVYYRCQVLWQIDVLGVDEGHVAVLGPGGFRAYVVRRDERDLRLLRAAGERFMARLASGEAPDVDDHPATGQALKALHPSLEAGDVEVPVALAEGYRRARALRARVEAVADGYETRIRAALGAKTRAVCNGKLVASRSVYDQSGDAAELTAIETDWPVVDRLNPGRSKTYAG
ncbi:lambda-exonuclease family protein [Rhizomonospora bruguierae]|uniref:lambda-exonuclease family protein n=1 Tax=Rhizomonospora bruguierae TaxID=1581705 RepID=UPI001BCF411A|nr:YqaJ viral recombinase family protein [Micromonospora sp. NBRC 107566]